GAGQSGSGTIGGPRVTWPRSGGAQAAWVHPRSCRGRSALSGLSDRAAHHVAKPVPLRWKGDDTVDLAGKATILLNEDGAPRRVQVPKISGPVGFSGSLP